MKEKYEKIRHIWYTKKIVNWLSLFFSIQCYNDYTQ